MSEQKYHATQLDQLHLVTFEMLGLNIDGTPMTW
jgi:hypothetical protein